MEESSTKPKEKIVERLIEKEMKQNYLDYSMSVIVGRALPDVRDGLKPVHRRVLYSMHDMGMFHNKPFKKCARIVGECLGKYHPHGDTAVYDTLVRMAQTFSLRYPLINGQGNFGSVDGDSAAAMRYTEARLKKIADEMLHDIDKETVKFTPNFDGSLKEPSVLPAKLPNLLINGSTGIAVGMATNIPPHNLSETVDAVIMKIDNPEVTVKELMQSIIGPDFPTAGIICGRAGIKDMYETGKGKVKVRARADIVQKKDKERIIISEIPYMVNKSVLLEEIASLTRQKIIGGISDIRDESDRKGIRVVIELKKGANSDVVLNQLFKHTRMQTTFGVIMLALVDNQPKILNLNEILGCYIKHRQIVVRKRTKFELKKAEARAHILEGLMIALKDIDKTIKLIKGSSSVDSARTKLIDYLKITRDQSQAILDMRLQKLTSLETEKIKKEFDELQKIIAKLKEILGSEKKILQIIKEELIEIKKAYGDARRTQIGEASEEIDVEDLIEEEDMVVTISHLGYIKRLGTKQYRQQKRGGKGAKGAETKEEDFIEDLFVASTHSYILFFTNKGKVFWRKVHEIPEGSRQARGKAIVNLLTFEQGEEISAFVPVKDFKGFLMMATKKGTIKKTSLELFNRPRKSGIIAITLDKEDELIEVKSTDGNQEIILATRKGMAARFKDKDIRPTGRSSQGVRGMRLKDSDKIIGMVTADESKTLLTITKHGYGKRTKIDDYRLIKRGGRGVKNIICSERNGPVVAVKSVVESDDVIFISKHGIVIRTPIKGINTIGRNTQGVRLMKLGKEDKVMSAATIVKEENGNNKIEKDMPKENKEDKKE